MTPREFDEDTMRALESVEVATSKDTAYPITILKTSVKMNRRTRIGLEYKARILGSLARRLQPVDVESIRLEAGIGNWNTALKHCLELLIEGKIRGQKTSRGWVFWVKDHGEGVDEEKG
jgi:hypothetical protein